MNFIFSCVFLIFLKWFLMRLLSGLKCATFEIIKDDFNEVNELINDTVYRITNNADLSIAFTAVSFAICPRIPVSEKLFLCFQLYLPIFPLITNLSVKLFYEYLIEMPWYLYDIIPKNFLSVILSVILYWKYYNIKCANKFFLLFLFKISNIQIQDFIV